MSDPSRASDKRTARPGTKSHRKILPVTERSSEQMVLDFDLIPKVEPKRKSRPKASLKIEISLTVRLEPRQRAAQLGLGQFR